MRQSFTYCFWVILVVFIGAASDPSAQGATQRETTVYPVVFVVRHAEAYKNVSHPSGMAKEKLDSLTPRGIEQARKAGAYLKDKNVFAVISSPTGRTRQTARIIAEESGSKGSFVEDPAFESMKKGRTSKGKLVGWSWREAQWKAGRDPRPEGGESLEDATKRAVQALKALIKQYPGKVFVIVTHSDICAGLAGQAGGTPYPERYEKHKTALGSVSEIAFSPDGT